MVAFPWHFHLALCPVFWSLCRLVPDCVASFWEWIESVLCLLAFPMSLFAICPWRSHLSLDKDFQNSDKILFIHCLEPKLNLWLTLLLTYLWNWISILTRGTFLSCKASDAKRFKRLWHSFKVVKKKNDTALWACGAQYWVGGPV